MVLIDTYKSWGWPTFSSTTGYSYEQYEEDGNIIININLPGVNKKEAQLSYNEDSKKFTIFAKEKVDDNIYIQRQIEPEKVEAILEDGVLRIRAPIKNSDRQIQIK